MRVITVRFNIQNASNSIKDKREGTTMDLLTPILNQFYHGKIFSIKGKYSALRGKNQHIRGAIRDYFVYFSGVEKRIEHV